MEPVHGKLLYEGKAKRIYACDAFDEVLVNFKNAATAFNAQKKSSFARKGFLNCQISAHLFELLELKGIKTHYLGLGGDSWMYANRVEVIPLEIVLRNIAYGSLCRETPISPGTRISPPLIDFYYKDDDLQDPLLSESRLRLLGLISSKKKIEMEETTMRVNEILKEFFAQIDLELVDFKLEMGFNQLGELVIADEISPDNCRIWDQRIDDDQDRILDKDRFRKDLGSLVESYEKILDRIQVVSSKPHYYK